MAEAKIREQNLTRKDKLIAVTYENDMDEAEENLIMPGDRFGSDLDNGQL